MDEKYMFLAILEAKKSLKYNDIPVGALIVKDDKIISRSFNKCNRHNSIQEHAEINCINKAIKKTKDKYLDDCILYVTMEPCLMCFGAIQKTNIKKIVYGIENEKTGFLKYINFIPKIEIEKNICKEDIKKMLNDFFEKKRN